MRTSIYLRGRIIIYFYTYRYSSISTQTTAKKTAWDVSILAIVGFLRFSEFFNANLIDKDEFRTLVILLRTGINKFIIEINLLFWVSLNSNPPPRTIPIFGSVRSGRTCARYVALRQRTDCFRTRKSKGENTHCGNVIFRVFCSIDDFFLLGSSMPKSIER